MIPISRSAAWFALAGSVALHSAGFVFQPAPDPVRIAGGTGAEIAMLGNGFADLVEGTISPTPPTDIEKAQEIETISEPVQPEPTRQAPVPKDVITAPKPVAAQTTTTTQTPKPPLLETILATVPKISAITNSVTVSATPQIETATASSVSPSTPIDATATKTAKPIETTSSPNAAETSTPPAVTTSASPVLKPTQTASPEGEITAIEPPLRPQTRPRNFAKTLPPEPTSKPRPAPQKPTGNATQSTKRGIAQGAKQASASAASTGQNRSSQQGNAAASNYPGEVFRRVSRVRRPRLRAKGSALVAFRIADNGALATVGIKRSSGSAKLDRAALKIIQRAAPFPPPPPNARRSFSIEIKGE